MGFRGSPNNVIRNNEIVGSETHWWNDVIEGSGNPFTNGGPYRDTDVHGNTLVFGSDDGTELDGGAINVRYWDNHIEHVHSGISSDPNRMGPTYIFRNLTANMGDVRGEMAAGLVFKLGGSPIPRDRGFTLIAHNTHFGRGRWWANGDYDGNQDSQGRRVRFRGFLRNNVCLAAGQYLDASDGSGRIERAALPLVVAPRAGDYRLAASSSGIDGGVVIAGLNDGFAGRAPDMGTFEHGLHRAGIIPHRPSGMAVRPQRAGLTYVPNKSASSGKAAVALLVPPAAGRRWVAKPNAPWLRCTPSSGPAAGAPKNVTLECLGKGLTVKCHRAAVVFRTDLGLNCALMAHVKVYPADRFSTIIEAEDGEVTPGMKRTTDEAASGGLFVQLPLPHVGVKGELRPAPPGAVRFTFDVPADGVYYVVGRCLAPEPSGAHNSFLFSMDGAGFRAWDVHAKSKAYCWNLLNLWHMKGRKLKRVDPLSFKLSKGTHSLVLKSREAGTRLDCIAITNYPYPPE